MANDWQGITSWIGYLFAMINEGVKYLFIDPTTFSWTRGSVEELAQGLSGQWILNGNMPELSVKGEDIVAAIMTIAHNGLVFVAQLVTLLPANVSG